MIVSLAISGLAPSQDLAIPDTVVTTSDVETKEVVYVTSCNDTRVVVTG